MKHTTKVCFFVLFVMNMIICYRVSRQLNDKMDAVIWKHDHTPSKSIKVISALEDRIYSLEQSEECHE